jgi:hypothetical protein
MYFDDNNPELFDDCPICQAQKKAIKEGRKMTLEEFKKAAKQAQQQGAIHKEFKKE